MTPLPMLRLSSLTADVVNTGYSDERSWQSRGVVGDKVIGTPKFSFNRINSSSSTLLRRRSSWTIWSRVLLLSSSSSLSSLLMCFLVLARMALLRASWESVRVGTLRVPGVILSVHCYFLALFCLYYNIHGQHRNK